MKKKTLIREWSEKRSPKPTNKMTKDKQREWRIDLAEMLAQKDSVRTYESDRHESPQVVTGTLRFREAFSNNLRRVYRVLVPWVEALLDKTRKEVAEEIRQDIIGEWHKDEEAKDLPYDKSEGEFYYGYLEGYNNALYEILKVVNEYLYKD